MTHHLIHSYVAIGSVCGAVFLLHLMIFLRRREERIHLVFALMALCCALATILDIRMHLASDVNAFVWALKATNTVRVLLWIAFAWFIRLSPPMTTAACRQYWCRACTPSPASWI